MQARDHFFTFTTAELYSHFSVGHDGLTTAEARERLKRYGRNQLTPKKPISPWAVYFSQFKNSLIIILLAAAALIFFVWLFGERDQADLVESVLILAIILMITFLGFMQEYKAEKAVEALKKLLAFKAKVIRQGKEHEVNVTELVPGDVVVLEEGMKVPADIRLLDVAVLQVSEASLTGESTPIEKTVEPIKGFVQLADQKNMVFAGTTVTQGRGLGVVTVTGDHTEIGKIAKDVAEATEEATPIQKRLDNVGKVLGYGVLAISIFIFLFIVFFASEFTHLQPFERALQSFIFSISLAVAAVPEGLPAVVTIALALGTQRMLTRNALIRRLNSAETLGSTDTICADKTGTLTKGEMTVTEIAVDGAHYMVSGTGYETQGEITLHSGNTRPSELELILKAGLLCNNAKLEGKEKMGDPTELALLVSAAKNKVKAGQAERIKEIPFSSERKMMSVLVKEGDETAVYSKGAPEMVLPHCTHILKNGKVTKLTATDRETILKTTKEMAEKALRTLAFAYRPAKKTEKEFEDELILIGLQGMIDPPRAEIRDLIKSCETAGIRTIMITGDHVDTAKAVAKEIGITGNALTGVELDKLSDQQLAKAVDEVRVYARVNPGMKMRIVEALKKNGRIVAMTGDGVNDAPALKKADMGIAMGITGTDVAKEAADMVLLDDKFATIIAAIEEGRGIFDNIRKFVDYLLSCNIGEVLVVFFAVMFFQEVPLTTIMLLWINVVTDGLPAIALGLDPAEKGIMQYSPKKFQTDIIDAKLWVKMVLFGTLMTVGILWLYQFNLSESVEEARGIAFNAIVVFELVRLFIIRTSYRTSFFSNPWLLGAIGASLGLQLVIMYIPAIANLFKIHPIDLHDWALIIGWSAAIWIVYKLFEWLISQTLFKEKSDSRVANNQ